MRREHPNPNPNPNRHPSMAASSSAGCGYLPAANIWEEECDAGMDELLAAMGYKVRSSDMADVAQKLEQLEEAMCSVQQDNLSQLASDSVHYNPSDLSTWLQTMISELNPPPTPNFMASSSSSAAAAAAAATPSSTLDDSFLAPAESSTITSVDYVLHSQRPTRSSQQQSHSQSRRSFEESCSSDYDLTAIPGKAVYSAPQAAAKNQNQLDSSSSSSSRETKRMKPSIGAGVSPAAAAAAVDSARPIVVVDSQEDGIRLVHALMACAEAVQSNSLAIADALMKQINYLTASQAGAMRKVATYFAQALARRIYGLYPENPIADHSLSHFLQSHFYETCPYLKFAHFTANQAILEAFQGKNRVHVIDFSMNQGMQWPALMQALALRPGGAPAFRLTGIGPPSHDSSDYLQDVGWKLAQLAETINVDFEYRGFVANSLADLDASMLELRPSEGEAVAVNSVFELHKLLARPGAIEKVLSVVKQMRPEIVTVVEQEANHNGAGFLDRFTEALHYYSTMFDSLEGSAIGEDKVMSEVYLGKQIANVVACEGSDRVERHETLEQWRGRLGEAGFEPAHLGSNAFKQASMLLALYAVGDGYGVEEKSGCLTLGWHTRPLIATSAWKLAAVAH